MPCRFNGLTLRYALSGPQQPFIQAPDGQPSFLLPEAPDLETEGSMLRCGHRCCHISQHCLVQTWAYAESALDAHPVKSVTNHIKSLHRLRERLWRNLKEYSTPYVHTARTPVVGCTCTVKKDKRKVYAVRRHSESLCLKRQPGMHSDNLCRKSLSPQHAIAASNQTPNRLTWNGIV